MKRKKKQRLILDVDSTVDPAHGMQENVAFNGHFGKTCFHPLFALTNDGDCLRAKLRPGNVYSADAVLAFLDSIVKRYRARFVFFWLRGGAACAQRGVYEYCGGERVTNFIKRLIKVGAKIARHGRRWHVHVASAFPLSRYYQAVFG